MKKLLRSEICLYLIFGVLTTIVYFMLRFLVVNITNKSLLAVVIAQIGAVLFAFITNKYFVFKDKEKNYGIVLKQFISFLLGRSVVFILDLVITFIGVEKYSTFFINLFHLSNLPYENVIFNNSLTRKFIGTPELLNEFIFALFVQVIAIILNYIISKKKVFKEDVKV